MEWNCKAIEDRMPELLDGALPPHEVSGAEAHLATCETCGARVREFRETWALLDRYPAVDPSPDFTETVLERVRTRSGSISLRVLGAWVPGGSAGRRIAAALAASLILALCLAWLFAGKGLFTKTGEGSGETFVVEADPSVDEPRTEELLAETELMNDLERIEDVELLELLEDMEFLEEYGEDVELAFEADVYDLLNDAENL